MLPGTPPLKKAGFKEMLLWALGQRRRFRVEGDSMLPLLKSGDEVLINPSGALSVGDIVVCRHPIQSDITIIKQIEAIEGDRIVLTGLNENSSSDSYIFGFVDQKLIIGLVTSKF
ncbi:MAG: nickel-type superoxide dismutase maturation protease [Candidatus Peregrinibacteria bacterium]